MKKYIVISKRGYLCHKDGITTGAVLMTGPEAIERTQLRGGRVEDFRFFEATEVTPVQTGWSLP